MSSSLLRQILNRSAAVTTRTAALASNRGALAPTRHPLALFPSALFPSAQTTTPASSSPLSTTPRSFAREDDRDPRDRTRKIPLELSLKYMDSPAYRETYGDHKVWELYRRNFAKGRTYVWTRKTCVKDGKLWASNACPICRDEYLVVDYRNVRLISQFIKDYNGEIMNREVVGVCREQWLNIRVALEKAKDHGYLDLDPPFVEYDYDKYMDHKSNH